MYFSMPVLCSRTDTNSQRTLNNALEKDIDKIEIKIQVAFKDAVEKMMFRANRDNFGPTAVFAR